MPKEPAVLHESVIARNQAQARAADAEAQKHLAEARRENAEADEQECEAAKARINLEREQHKRRKELADDEFHHRYLFDSEVGESSVKKCISQLAVWERSATGDEPVTVDLVINSPGGSVFDGFALIDYIGGMHDRGHTVNTVAYGMAASMAGVLLQAGKERAMGANAMLLVHEASFGAIGSFGKVEDQVKLVELMHGRILDLFASRSKMSKTAIKRRWRRRDWWIDSTECLKHGFVDRVC